MSAASGRERPVKSGKKLIVHRRVRSLRPIGPMTTPRWENAEKKNLTNLCALRVLCGEILLENGIGFHDVSYKAVGAVFFLDPADSLLAVNMFLHHRLFALAEVPGPI